MDKKALEHLVKYLSEIGMLSRCVIQGPKFAGVVDTEFLCGHIVRTSQIAYILAELEDANPETAACIALFHDNAEIRIGDQTKIGSRYYDAHAFEEKVIEEQIENLPRPVSQRLKNYFSLYKERNTKEGIVAKDADWLATAIYAKELVEKGYKGMQDWIDNVKAAVETESAKAILEYIDDMEDYTNDWWQGLKKMTYIKIKKADC